MSKKFAVPKFGQALCHLVVGDSKGAKQDVTTRNADCQCYSRPKCVCEKLETPPLWVQITKKAYSKAKRSFQKKEELPVEICVTEREYKKSCVCKETKKSSRRKRQLPVRKCVREEPVSWKSKIDEATDVLADRKVVKQKERTRRGLKADKHHRLRVGRELQEDVDSPQDTGNQKLNQYEEDRLRRESGSVKKENESSRRESGLPRKASLRREAGSLKKESRSLGRESTSEAPKKEPESPRRESGSPRRESGSPRKESGSPRKKSSPPAQTGRKDSLATPTLEEILHGAATRQARKCEKACPCEYSRELLGIHQRVQLLRSKAEEVTSKTERCKFRMTRSEANFLKEDPRACSVMTNEIRSQRAEMRELMDMWQEADEKLQFHWKELGSLGMEIDQSERKTIELEDSLMDWTPTGKMTRMHRDQLKAEDTVDAMEKRQAECRLKVKEEVWKVLEEKAKFQEEANKRDKRRARQREEDAVTLLGATDLMQKYIDDYYRRI
ncbi:uncharacterized protein LOC111673940 [Orussus abietinus]|uniref:uncharacterized protein LOC111673940 n=1 Tax=Orussus abietinus TaxID=222816 RepID=UPI000C716296|nr:uncharacterized protein LOC111673940 [Orussus abietinus]